MKRAFSTVLLVGALAFGLATAALAAQPAGEMGTTAPAPAGSKDSKHKKSHAKKHTKDKKPDAGTTQN